MGCDEESSRSRGPGEKKKKVVVSVEGYGVSRPGAAATGGDLEALVVAAAGGAGWCALQPNDPTGGLLLNKRGKTTTIIVIVVVRVAFVVLFCEG